MQGCLCKGAAMREGDEKEKNEKVCVREGEYLRKGENRVRII